jgi:hypothetical protein
MIDVVRRAVARSGRTCQCDVSKNSRAKSHGKQLIYVQIRENKTKPTTPLIYLFLYSYRSFYSVSSLSSKSLRTPNPAHSMLARCRCSRRWQHPISTISLLVNGDIVRQSAKQIELPFNPAKDLLRWGQEFEIAKSEKIPNQ